MQTVSETAPQYRGETRKLFRPRPSKRFLVNTSHLLYFFKSLLGPIMKVIPTGLHSRQLICFSPTGSSDIMWLLEWFCNVPRWIMDRGEKGHIQLDVGTEKAAHLPLARVVQYWFWLT